MIRPSGLIAVLALCALVATDVQAHQTDSPDDYCGTTDRVFTDPSGATVRYRAVSSTRALEKGGYLAVYVVETHAGNEWRLDRVIERWCDSAGGHPIGPTRIIPTPTPDEYATARPPPAQQPALLSLASVGYIGVLALAVALVIMQWRAVKGGDQSRL